MTVLIQGDRVTVVDAASALAVIERGAASGIGVATVGAGLPERLDAHRTKREQAA